MERPPVAGDSVQKARDRPQTPPNERARVVQVGQKAPKETCSDLRGPMKAQRGE